MLVAAVTRRPGGTSAALIEQVDAAADQGGPDELDERITAAGQEVLGQFAASMPRQDAAPAAGYLVLNPASHVRRAVLELPALARLPAVSPPVYATHEEGADKRAVVDVPPMGFAWLSGAASTSRVRRPPRVLAEEGRLFNEFLEMRHQSDNRSVARPV